ncbi:hypothetical protein GGI24_002366 [Coemansia furcata]|nr:hypothetical protein GGI24_002366 [Coemansia furcata]
MDNFNFFGYGDIPVIPAPDRVQQLEAMLQQVSDESSQKDRTVASYGAAVTEANMRIFGLNLTVADYRRRVSMLERNNNAHHAANLDLGRKLGDRDRTVSAQASAIYGLTNQLNGRDRTIGECRSSIASYEQTTVSQALEVIDLGNKLNERDSTIADLQRTVTELQHANADHVHTNGDFQCTVTELRNSNAELMRINGEQGDTIANLQRTVAALQHRDSAHVHTINGLQRTVADLQQANTGHVQTIDELERANADQQNQLNEAHCASAICLGGINYLINRYTEYEYRTEIHRQSLEAAIAPQDIPIDDDDSDVSDIVVDIPTAEDAVATTFVIASPVIGPLSGLHLSSFDLTGTAHQGPLGAIYDQSGAEVTSKHLLAVIKPFVFIDLDLLLVIYHSTYGRQLISGHFNPRQLVKTLAKLDGFGYLTPRTSSEQSTNLAVSIFLQRCDLENETLRDNILLQLGLADDPNAVVLGSVLCFTLVTLCGTHMDQMTGSLLDQVFMAATRIKLQMLWVATASGTKQMSKDDICLTVKSWVEDLSNFVALNGIDSSLDIATHYYNQYVSGSSAGGDASEGNVAARSDMKDEHNYWLLLGISADDLRELSKVLVHVAESGTSPQIKDCLRQVSMKLQHQSV